HDACIVCTLQGFRLACWFRRPHRNNLFSFFCWPAREMGALPRPCRLALRVTAKQLLAAPILALRDITRYLVSRIPRGFSAVFLRRVPESEDRCGADRTLDRAGAAQESAARSYPVHQRTVSRVASVKRRWR